MTSSGTVKRLKKASETDAQTVWKTPEGVSLVQSEERRGNAVMVSTLLYNGSDCEITVEMLASVAIRHITADNKIHRLQSF